MTEISFSIDSAVRNAARSLLRAAFDLVRASAKGDDQSFITDATIVLMVGEIGDIAEEFEVDPDLVLTLLAIPEGIYLDDPEMTAI